MAKILIAEDEPDIRDLVAFTLRFAGYEVVTASNGEDAVSLAPKEVPDLILMDVRMPRMTGYDACRLIKTEAKVEGYPGGLPLRQGTGERDPDRAWGRARRSTC